MINCLVKIGNFLKKKKNVTLKTMDSIVIIRKKMREAYTDQTKGAIGTKYQHSVSILCDQTDCDCKHKSD